VSELSSLASCLYFFLTLHDAKWAVFARRSPNFYPLNSPRQFKNGAQHNSLNVFVHASTPHSLMYEPFKGTKAKLPAWNKIFQHLVTCTIFPMTVEPQTFWWFNEFVAENVFAMLQRVNRVGY